MGEKNLRRLKKVFYALIVVFILIMIGMTPMSMMGGIMRIIMIFIAFASWILFFLLGIILLVFTLKSKVKGKLKVFLLLTGISAAGFLLSVILHNLFYGLFIYLFGEGFWSNGDEPIFFIIAVFVCPIVFLIGAIGSIILFRRRQRHQNKK